ncbi:hypothetical protein TIFTF001_030736 [Ficus carica]|uniref:Uncharacterized protein n=1 Tax=Ficus carica TaxID=3494 RepID=A0AA88DTS4_FICCA|nr:hypothetical protein TIFTF001_030736 [Ficus carica]
MAVRFDSLALLLPSLSKKKKKKKKKKDSGLWSSERKREREGVSPSLRTYRRFLGRKGVAEPDSDLRTRFQSKVIARGFSDGWLKEKNAKVEQ